MATKKIRGYIRDPADGSGVSGATVSIKRHNGDTTVTTDATDADGLYEVDNDTLGYPGPVYESVTVGSTTKIKSGEVWGQLGGLIWPADISDVFSALGIGVLGGVGNELEVTANSSGMQVHVNSGIGLLKDGVPYVKEATSDVTITTADATHPRIDQIVLRLVREGQTDQGKITLIAIAGTPAASPAAPSLTQSSSTWDMSLATVLVDANASTISAGKVTDTRSYMVSDERLDAVEASLAGAQPLDATLTALAAFATNGLVTRTGSDTFAGRTLTGTASEIAVTNGDGVSGNPTIALATGISAAKIGGGGVSSTEFDFLNGVTSAIQTQLNGKSSTGHTHTGSGEAQIVEWKTKDSGFSALDTTQRTMDTLTFGPLSNGVTYDVVVEVHLRLSVDSTGYARAVARWASDTAEEGERTGSVGGERSCLATTSKMGIVGDGSTTYSVFSRAEMDVSAGSCASSHIRVVATPRS